MGIEPAILFAQLINLTLLCVFPLAWMGLAILAIWQIRKRNVPDPSRVLWLILIFFVPVLGSLAFLFLHQDDSRKTP